MPYYKLSDLAAELKALPSCLARTADVLHYLDGEHTAQYLPRLLRRAPLRHTKTLATFHQPPQLLRELVNKDIAAELDHVALVSPVQRSFFEYLPEERVSVLMHGIDVDFYQPASEAVPETPFRCITVGHWLRDWSTFRFVARALPAVEFHYVTDRQTGLEDLSNVKFHRNVDDRSLRSLYQQSHLLFLPLTGATANNTLLEGIACGLPVVASDLESIRAYLGEAGILVEENHPDLFANAVEELQRDRNLRTVLARKSRARAES
jgi:glycosyltransferase involved in cell wall biosynthesis